MNIYFCGSMTHSQEKREFYKSLIEYLNSFGEVLNPFVGEKMVEKKAIDIYKRDTNNLKNADILIADVSVVSTGVGFELGYADLLKIKTLIIYDENYPTPSSLILGNPNFVIKSYKSLDEAINICSEFINKGC
ncbi:MAG: hypothetical protein E7172_02200 [Firmicutes bacterium]|nr:hypothetical protein [Bacillota bacterium]